MIDFENMLPKKRCFKMDEDPTPDDDYKLGYNKALDDCKVSLKAAEARGEIGRVLGISELYCILKSSATTMDAADNVRKVMLSKE